MTSLKLLKVKKDDFPKDLRKNNVKALAPRLRSNSTPPIEQKNRNSPTISMMLYALGGKSEQRWPEDGLRKW
jgi:hypothetical protein